MAGSIPTAGPEANSEVQSELTFAFFAAVNHISGPLRTQRFTSTGFVICGWWIPICLVCFSVSRGAFYPTKIRL